MKIELNVKYPYAIFRFEGKLGFSELVPIRAKLNPILKEAKYKIIRNSLSKEKTNKFNLVLKDELLKIDNSDYNNLLLSELQSALNSGLTILDIIKGK